MRTLQTFQKDKNFEQEIIRDEVGSRLFGVEFKGNSEKRMWEKIRTEGTPTQVLPSPGNSALTSLA